MITKFGSAKIVEVGEARDLIGRSERIDHKIRQSSIRLDPSRYLYVINHSVSAYEVFGPNENADAFPEKELRERHYTFIQDPVTVDHVSLLAIGSVLDSVYVEPVDPNDPTTGHFVENVWAIDKKKADAIDPLIIPGILEGRITDTSMGAVVEYTRCSVCGNVAHTENEYCAHVASMKGKRIRTASGEERMVFEICYGVTFFEDSLIRPLEYGGMAGGAGADPYAKIRRIITTASSRVFIPSGFEEVRKTVVGGSEEQPPEPKSVAKPEKIVEKLMQGDEEDTQYPVTTLKEEIEKHFVNRFEEKEFEIEVSDQPNLFEKIPDDELMEILSPLFSEVGIKLSSETKPSPEHEEQFQKLLELVKFGLPVGTALRVVRHMYEFTVTPDLVEEVLNSLCSSSKYTITGNKVVFFDSECLDKCKKVLESMGVDYEYHEPEEG